jgi:hypothetical protein
MNQFSTFQPTPAKFNRERAAWCCPSCGAELARVKTWPKENRLVVANDFLRNQEGTYQKPKAARRWIRTQAGRNYAAKLQSEIDRTEANARRWEAIAQETNANSEEAEEPNGPDVQARCCRQYAQIIRGTLDSLKRSEQLWLPETPDDTARRKLLAQCGVKPPTMEEKEQLAARAWTDPKEFTAEQINKQPLKFFCCNHLRSIPSMRSF